MGDKLKIEHPNVVALNLLNKEIDDLDGLREVGRRYPDLRQLNLSNNEIKEIPGGTFIGFSNLEELGLAYNAITNLSDGVHVITPAFMRAKAEGRGPLVSSFAGLTALQRLYLSMNNLSSLPESFGGLTGLKMLWLEWNDLSSLPESFGDLAALEELQIHTNELRSLPESFGNLSALKRLLLGRNKLNNLPASFNRLASLSYLVLSNNYLGTTYNISWVERPGWRDPTISPLVERLRDLPLHKLHLGDNGLQEKVINQVKAALPDAMVGL